ncbi:DinB family protein [Paenibacillus sp. sptzw28]|uniref:DinB family protein n=1 Tax=Paenibacillus sp. sptzw28 TaxID=715179 RepID=UPI001C6EA621|nr:DinB family protein [Paenibacillus sp. sptzw28]QYR19786.1 DinB family protein [Paenibacillus sp. sptzw28]
MNYIQTSTELLKSFHSFVYFVDSLRLVQGKTWVLPLKPDKWAMREVISHILLWDRYFLEEAIAKIAEGTPVTLKHVDYDTFNQNARPYALTIGQAEMLDQTIACRNEIIGKLRGLSEEDLYFEHIDGDGQIFTVIDYLKGFTEHDAQHRGEIEAFLHRSED